MNDRLKDALRRATEDPTVHDGIACTVHRGCPAHRTHPCEGCGRQWPQNEYGWALLQLYALIENRIETIRSICAVPPGDDGVRIASPDEWEQTTPDTPKASDWEDGRQ